MTPKLTDEELSRILSQAAIGKLLHSIWGSLDDGPYDGCGCIMGAALALGGDRCSIFAEPACSRAVAISDILYPGQYGALSPDKVLRYLEEKGLT